VKVPTQHCSLKVWGQPFVAAAALPRGVQDHAGTKPGGTKPRAIALCTYLSAVLLVGLVLNSLFN